MNKTELVAAIADKAEISKKDSEKALKAFVDVVTEELKKGHKIQLVGFGTFETSERAASFNLHCLPCRRISSLSCSSLACLECSESN